MRRKILTAGILATATLAWTGCGGSGPEVRYSVLEPGADSLRAAFNADEGKVRALFLASPT